MSKGSFRTDGGLYIPSKREFILTGGCKVKFLPQITAPLACAGNPGLTLLNVLTQLRTVVVTFNNLSASLRAKYSLDIFQPIRSKNILHVVVGTPWNFELNGVPIPHFTAPSDADCETFGLNTAWSRDYTCSLHSVLMCDVTLRYRRAYIRFGYIRWELRISPRVTLTLNTSSCITLCSGETLLSVTPSSKGIFFFL